MTATGIHKSRSSKMEQAGGFTTELQGDEYLWTSGFLNERFGEPVSPLGWSLIRELLEDLAFREPLRYMGYAMADSLPVIKLYKGHPFINVMVFQILYKPFPDFFLPEDAHRYFPDGDTGYRKRANYPTSILQPRFLISMLKAFLNDPKNWSPWRHLRKWDRFLAEHQEKMADIDEKIECARNASNGLSPTEILGLIDRVQKLNRKLLALHRWSLTHADLLYSLLRRTLAFWLGAKQGTALSAELVSSLPNKSLEIDQELQKLANIPSGEAFESSLTDFITRYGHRSFSLDIYLPDFSSDPSQVRKLIENLKEGGSDFHRTNIAQKRETARSQVRAVFKKRFYPNPIKWLIGRITIAFCNHIIRLVKRYMPLREDQRFYWQKGLAAIRELVLILGDRLVNDRLLEDCQGIFFATKDEIEDHVKRKHAFDPYQAQGIQREFRKLQAEYRLDPNSNYPAFLIGNRPLETSLEGNDYLVGQPVSPGIKLGPVRIVGHPDQFKKIRFGDILVTQSTDPGWTPIFAKLGGLIMEAGEATLSRGVGRKGIWSARRDWHCQDYPALKGWPAGETGRHLREGQDSWSILKNLG